MISGAKRDKMVLRTRSIVLANYEKSLKLFGNYKEEVRENAWPQLKQRQEKTAARLFTHKIRTFQ